MRRKTLRETEAMLRRYPVLQNMQSRRLRRWREAIDDTLEEYEKSGEQEKTELLARHYFDGLPDAEALKSLHIGRRTYFTYKRDILCTAAFYAAKKGLL